MSYSTYLSDCPEAALVATIGGRWVALVIHALAEDGGPVRHSEIAHRIPGITQRMLTQTLRTLERDGLVRREISDDVPVRVFYSLTGAGMRLAQALHPLREWVAEHADGVARARREYDEGRAGGVPTVAETNALRARRRSIA